MSNEQTKTPGEMVLAEIERLKLALETITADRDAEKNMKALARYQRDEAGHRIEALKIKLNTSEERNSELRSALQGMVEYFPEGHSEGECFSVEKAKAVLAGLAPRKDDQAGKTDHGLLQGIVDLKNMKP